MSQWSEFLRKLNPTGQRQISAIWRMSDGQSFPQQIPAAELIGEEELAAPLKFTYKLYETNELEFSAAPAVDSEPVDLEEIEQAARTSGLIYRRKPDRIIIRSPYTC